MPLSANISLKRRFRMKSTTTILSTVMLTLALTVMVSACARRADKPVVMTPDIRDSRSEMSSTGRTSTGEDAAVASAVGDRLVREHVARPGATRVDSERGTVYLRGAVDTPQDKQRAGELAAGVPGVTNVVNQLGVGRDAMVAPGSTSGVRGDAGQCSLALRNPAMRTEAIFAPIQVRVFDNPASNLNRTTDRSYDQRDRRALTAAEIDALERQKGRPLTDAEIRSLEMERGRTASGRDVLPSTEASPRSTVTQADIRDLELQKGRPLTDAELYDLEQERRRPSTGANAPTMTERGSLSRADAQAGDTGGREQDTGSAQQAGTSGEIGRSRPTSTAP